jgi:RNA polymerase sigma-70 factor (ECF subfamily)
VKEDELDRAMTRLAAGDRSAFDVLYEALHPRAVYVAKRRLRDPALALDAAQSTLLQIFARASEFEPGAKVLPWFYAVCANEVRRTERKRGATASSPEGSQPELSDDDALSADEQLHRAEMRRALAHAIDELDAVSADAIGALLGEVRPMIPEATFRKRVSRAYARLRLLMGRFDVV